MNTPILVMTRRPGTIRADLVVDLPQPRLEDDTRVIALKRRIEEPIIGESEIER